MKQDTGQQKRIRHMVPLKETTKRRVDAKVAEYKRRWDRNVTYDEVIRLGLDALDRQEARASVQE